MGASAVSSFGELLKEYRLAAELTQEALAERAGVSARNIQNLERGENRPLKDTARRLAAALGLGDRDRALLLTTVISVPRRRGSTPTTLNQPASETSAGPDPLGLGERRTCRPGSSSEPRHNLPVTLSSFIGREREQVRVRELSASHRLVTLVGTGGIGKTRLALAVAEQLRARYSDGVWLVELASLTDPALVPGAVAQVLRLSEEAGRPVTETLLAHLREKKLLLVLDNCEHLVGACAELASALLRGCPEVRLLVTSREALGITGERRYPVPSLSTPDPRHLPPPELAASFEAVRLFVERAQERRDDFMLSATNARAVADICARLDGVPLAIELAAARAGTLSVEAIATRLDDRFRLLTGGPRTALPRQQTLRATLDWSWELLDRAERTLLSRLAVFAGGWTLAAAEAVCREEDAEDVEVLDLLARLINRSLVQVDETDEAEGRYRLLESVRQFAVERLDELGETGGVRNRHLKWYLDLAEQAYPALRGSEQQRWLARLACEHDNLRAALRWASTEGKDPSATAILACNIYRFWWLRGHIGESRAWLSVALAGAGVPPALCARTFVTAGFQAWSQADNVQARVLLEEGVALYRDLGDRRFLPGALQALALVVERQGDYPRAVTLLEESLSLCEDAAGTAIALGILGQTAERQGDLAQATTWLERSLSLLRQLGDTAHVAEVLGTLGSISRRHGDNERAAALLEESLALHRELEDRWNTARELHALWLVCHAQGEQRRAAGLLRESVALFQTLEDRGGLVELLEDLAGVLGEQRQARLGARLLGAADAGRAAIGAPLPPGKRAQYEHTKAELAATLGEEAFAAAWVTGRAMALDEAVALALKDHTSSAED